MRYVARIGCVLACLLMICISGVCLAEEYLTVPKNAVLLDETTDTAIGKFTEEGIVTALGEKDEYTLVRFKTSEGVEKGYVETALLKETDAEEAEDEIGFAYEAQETKTKVESLQISCESLQLDVGEGEQLYVTNVAPDDATDSTVQWISDDESIARVDVSGYVTGVNPGKTKVRLVAKDGGAEAVCKVAVIRRAESVELGERELSVERGESRKIDASVLPEDTTDKGIVWESDKAYVVSVDEDGVVTGKERGQAVITAHAASDESITAQCVVTVLRTTLQAIEAQQTEITLGAGQTFALKWSFTPAEAEYSVSFKTSDKSVATVSEDGVVKGVKAGDAVITLRASDKSAECVVHVVKAPNKIELNLSSVTLGVGETVALEASIPEDTVGAWTFSAGREKVATVDENGVVTAVGKGETTITARTHNGKNAYCRVNVKNAPETLTFAEESYTVRAQESVQIEATPDKGAGGTITYSIADKNIARVTQDGVTGIIAGSTVVTATAYNGVTARTTLVVTPAPEKIECEDITLGVGQKTQAEYEIVPENAQSEITCASDDEKCVSVKKDGTLRAVSEGEATVTLTAYNGITGRLRVTVLPAPKEVFLSETEITLRVGETKEVSVSLPEGTMSGWTLKTGKKRVATVDENGAVTATGKGSTYLTVTTDNGRTASCLITVTD